MTDAPVTPPALSPASTKRRLPSLVFTILFGLLFGLVASSSLAAWAGSLLGIWGSLVLGAFCGLLLPLFLSVRAALALRSKKPEGVLLRRFVVLSLVVLIQTTAFLAGFVNLGQGPATPMQEMAAAATPVFHAVPGLGPWLTATARAGGLEKEAPPLPPLPPTLPTPGEPQKTPTSGTPAGATPAVAAGGGLQPRTGGRPMGTIAVAAETTDGNVVVVVWQVLFGGQATPRVLDLSALVGAGVVTRVEASNDGFVAVVLGGASVVTATPTGLVTEEKTLSRGAKIAGLEVQSVRDIAIAPGGALLAVVETFDEKSREAVAALVARAPGGAAFLVRRTGEVVDAPETKGAPATVSRSFSIKRGDGSGAVVIEEEFLEGGDDVGTKLAGTHWTLNPRRLLVGQADNPRALVEVARTGADPTGLPSATLQAFGEAVFLPDGRSVFVANFIEDSTHGWLFSVRRGEGVFALSPELIGKPEAPLPLATPRLRQLAVSPDATLAFVNRDGAVVVGPLANLASAQPTLLRATAVRTADARGAGQVSAATTVRLCGGDWVVAGVRLLDESGTRHDGVVLAGPQDRAQGSVEVLLEEGGLLPSSSGSLAAPSAPPPARVKSIFFDEGHEELLWHQGS
jgi:hypothetical protein